MNRTILDITELESWQGKPTGVPRVINELSIRFNKDNSIVFVIWRETKNKYNVVDFNPEKTSNIGKNITSSRVWLEKINAKNVIKHIIRRSKATSRLTEIIVRIIKEAKLKDASSTMANFSFMPDDVLLVMADWHANDVNFAQYLQKQHAIGVSIVQIVYDLLPIVTPQYSGHATEYVTRYAKTIYPLCDLVITISENTKKDIVGWLKANKIKTPPIEVIRLGDDFHKVKSVKPEAINTTSMNNYILCVGTIEARKNHMLLYYVYKLAYKRNIKLPDLIIVGRVGWHAENVYEMLTCDPEVNNNIQIMQNINDNELSWLYDNSLFTIYPSFYEGWGLPVAESIRRGKVCLSSSTSSLPEIAGELINYFDPSSTDECLESIVKLTNPITLKKAVEKIRNYKVTSWDDTFDAIWAIINRYEQ